MLFRELANPLCAGIYIPSLTSALEPLAIDLNQELQMRANLSSRQASIAIVDDDVHFLISLERNLRLAGFEVKMFASPEEFLACDTLFNPDLLLVDLHMSGIGGVKFILELNRRGVNAPVIFMTGHGQQETARELESVGSPQCLRKPFTAKSMRIMIDCAIKSHHSN